MICRTYSVPYGWRDVGSNVKTTSNAMRVFFFETDPYREQVGLHPYHKHKHVCAYCYNDGKPHALIHRTRQVERALRLAGYRGEIDEG